MRIKFDFLDLQAFLAVLETGSFHQAAERLSLSQPSVTRRIVELEESLGGPLFERTTRAVRPTLAAKRLQISARDLLDNAEETTRMMRDESQAFAHQRAQILTIATIPTVASTLVIPAIRAVQFREPNLRIRILDVSANAVAEAVTAGDADLGVTSISYQDPSTTFQKLFSDPIVLAMTPSCPLAARERLKWQDLRDQRLILPSRGTGNRLLIDDALAKADDQIQWRFEVGRSATALQLVKAQMGLALLPRLSIQDAETQDVVCKRIGEPEIMRPIGLVSGNGRTLSPAHILLRDALRTEARLILD